MGELGVLAAHSPAHGDRDSAIGMSWQSTLGAAVYLSACAVFGCTSQQAGNEGNGAGSSGIGAGGSTSSGGAGSSGVAQAGRAGAAAEAGAATGGANNASGEITCRAQGDGKSTITLLNQCTSPLTFAGSKITGGTLAPGEHACRDVGSATESIPAVRYWGWLGEDPGNERYTLAELTLNTNFNDFDFYNISHVDAHNLPMQVQPVAMPNCRVLTCAMSLLANCPSVGQERDASGKVISCFSPDRNDPNSVVAQYFEAGCKDAYSWSGDNDSVAACAGEDYDVVFCP